MPVIRVVPVLILCAEAVQHVDGFLLCRQLRQRGSSSSRSSNATCCTRRSSTCASTWQRRQRRRSPTTTSLLSLHRADCRWINADGYDSFDSRSNCSDASGRPTSGIACIAGVMADAVAYNQPNLSPTYWRLASSRLDVPDSGTATAAATAADTNDPFLQNADYAVEATLRWCSDFVAKLNLCPWAKLSLAEQNAVRVKVVDQTLGIGSFERIVRDSGLELLKLTGHEEYSSGNDMVGRRGGGKDAQFIDPNVAITFIIALPPPMDADVDCLDQEQQNLPEFNFTPFNDFVFDLEDRLFEEADAYAEAEEESQLQDDAQVPIGDWITVAPFHPAWSFAGDDDSPVAWEKRTPFPTVSVVRSDAIEAAGEEATARIAKHNEEVLSDMGSHALRDLFRRDILQRGTI